MVYHIMLLLTNECNLNCIYCYEHHKNVSKMTFHTAKYILDENIKKINQSDRIILELFGGEVFKNFSLMKEIYSYLSSNYSDYNISYETTTNGTLIHDEIQQWLYERRKHFSISLSLDGTPDMHNKNRIFKDGQGTYESIDINFFLTTWPHCPAKMTVSKLTLPNLASGVEYIEKLGFKCDATLAIGTSWPDSTIPVFMREVGKLTDYYIMNSNIELCTMLNFDFRQIFTPIDDNYRFCGAGIDLVCFDTYGNSYPCQGFAPISIGETSRNYLNFDEKNFNFTHSNTCKYCQCVRLCPNCYAANLQSCKNIQHVDPQLCKLYKLCILASAKIQGVRILSQKEFTHDDKLVLKAINNIQSTINIK